LRSALRSLRQARKFAGASHSFRCAALIVNFIYLLVYRAYFAFKEHFVEPSLRRWPLARRGFDKVKTFIKRRFFPGRPAWVQVQSGFAQGMWMRLRIPEEAGFWRGEHEPPVQKSLVSMVRTGDVVYDVGAHVGSLALGIARLVGTTGKVVAFDGDPGNVVRLQENSVRNGLQQCLQVVHAAVWSHSSGGRHQGISFRKGCDATTGGVEADGQRPVLADSDLIHVPATTLDDFVAGGGPVPQLIKIDVEGGEWHVLLGAANLVAEHRPRLIVEVHHQQADQQIRAWLQESRYAAEWKIPAENFPRLLIACPTEQPALVPPSQPRSPN
jgi:FkbM family methyltransferase